MIIKDKEIIEEGVKLFYTILTFKTACSGYFNFKNCGYEDDVIQDFLDFSEPQRMFLSTLWNDPKYSESYKKDPYVIIYNGPVEWSVKSVIPKNKNQLQNQLQFYQKYLINGHWSQNEIQENFIKYENFESKMIDFIYLKFRGAPLHEIQHDLELSDEQLQILLKTFNQLSKKIISNLEYWFYNGV